MVELQQAHYKSTDDDDDHCIEQSTLVL